MKALIYGVIFSCCLFLGEIQELMAKSTLATGETLQTNTYLSSPNGRYQLWMQGDGNLVLYDVNNNWQVTWMSYTPGYYNARVVMQDDGNLVIYDHNNYVPWMSGTNPVAHAELVVQDDGNLVIYGLSPVWQSGTMMGDCGQSLSRGNVPAGLQRISSLNFGFDGYNSPNVLPMGGRLTSQNGCYSLVFQNDLNLVIYRNTDQYVPWASWTQVSGTAAPGSRVVLQGDGNLVLNGPNGYVSWMTNTPTGWGKQLIMQNDGNLVLYTDRVMVWQKGNIYTYWADNNNGGGFSLPFCIGFTWSSSTGWDLGC